MLLSTPYYSQRINVTDPDWQWRACGVACVAMVLAHREGAVRSLDALVEEGREIGAYKEGVGWIHDGLVALAGRHGVVLAREEFKSDYTHGEELVEQGVQNILEALEAGRLVLVSAARGFDDPTKPHLVLLVGFEIKEGVVQGLYYHDPDAYTEKDGKNRFVSVEQFKRFWRRLAIFEASY